MVVEMPISHFFVKSKKKNPNKTEIMTIWPLVFGKGILLHEVILKK